MAPSPFGQLGLKEVINASGKMTSLGGSAQSAKVARALADAAGHHVELAALRAVAGAEVARRTGAQAGCITCGAAAGTAIGVAAMICRTNAKLVRQIPHPDTSRREIVLQRNHDINYGAGVAQTIAIGGGKPCMIENDVEALAAALTERTAGVVYVQSHHVRGESIALPDVVEVAGQRGVPVFVDAAAEEDLRKYLALGADLVTYSGGKAIGGPTVGFIAGRADLIEACELQGRGLARTMKVGKEQILGLLTALADYPHAASDELLHALHGGLEALSGLRVSIEDDLAGRDIRRVAIRSDDQEWLRGLVAFLRDGSPAIHTRHHRVDEGLLLLDVRELKAAQVPVIVARIKAYLAL